MTSLSSRLPLLLPLRAAVAVAATATAVAAEAAAAEEAAAEAAVAAEAAAAEAAAEAAEAADKATVAVRMAAVAVRETLKEPSTAADSQRPSQRLQIPVDEAGCAPPQRVASS